MTIAARVRPWLRRAGMDRAVAYATLAKLWAMPAGIATLLLITVCLTPASQGYYFTFFSLVALQTFFELGFLIAITQFASHEWARLENGDTG